MLAIRPLVLDQAISALDIVVPARPAPLNSATEGDMIRGSFQCHAELLSFSSHILERAVKDRYRTLLR
jgi:hypothetical protein